MEAIQLYRPQPVYQGPKAARWPAQKISYAPSNDRTAIDKHENEEDLADKPAHDDELRQFLEEHGLVDLGSKQPHYQRLPSKRSRIGPQNLYSPRLPQGNGQKNKYSRLDQLLAGAPKENQKGTSSDYTGINIKYHGSDGTMYQFSAAGPTQNKKQMVGQVLMGLYNIMIDDVYDTKKGADSQQNYRKAEQDLSADLFPV
ncbi:hypothetical protein HY772_06710 [Candidatus Woesearchaeota archaeon]|nr:hypothetical protein [Candidatus Woesearchaeota archaeon]